MKKKIYKYHLIFLILILCILFIPFYSSVWAALDNGIDIKISCGFDGVARLGAYSPLTLSIASDQDILGEAHIIVPLDEVRRLIIAKPLELKKGEQKDIDFEIPILSAKNDFTVCIVNGRKTIAEKAFTFKQLLSPESIVMGVLSDDKEAFSWLSGSSIPSVMSVSYERMKLPSLSMSTFTSAYTVTEKDYNERRSVVIPLNRHSFPSSNNVLNNFDVIWVAGYDTALLSSQQLEKLEDWVDSGGVLILCTGLEWQKVYHGLPQALKPFDIQETNELDLSSQLSKVTGFETESIIFRTTSGKIGFDLPENDRVMEQNPNEKTFMLSFNDNDILAGDEQLPLVIKYKKDQGSIVVFTFDPSTEPFLSYNNKLNFTKNIFRSLVLQNFRIFDSGSGYFSMQQAATANFQYLATNVLPSKNLPIKWIFISLIIYIIICGPLLYIILKKLDRRDLAWIIIPVFVLVFLTGMYFTGYNTRYRSAVMNTVSLIYMMPDNGEAVVSSSIAVFNDKRGTLSLSYDPNAGISPPLFENRYYYDSPSQSSEGKITAKYMPGNPELYEQYEVMLWTPTLLSCQKTVPVKTDLTRDLYIKDNCLKGIISNSSPYDLFDSAVIIGNKIISTGDILTGDTVSIDIPLDGEKSYTHYLTYLDDIFGREQYLNPKDYPKDYASAMQKRQLFQNQLSSILSYNDGQAKFTLLACNNQEIDTRIIVNEKDPVKYNLNLILSQSLMKFEPGREIEIPGGVISPFFNEEENNLMQYDNEGISINETGDLTFTFTLPEEINVNEITLSVKKNVPIYLMYTDYQNTEIIKNKYAYYIYNKKTTLYDVIQSTASFSGDIKDYTGDDNKITLLVKVLELGQPELLDNDISMSGKYEREMLSIPEIYIKGVIK